jgi:hypothetical protein
MIKSPLSVFRCYSFPAVGRTRQEDEGSRPAWLHKGDSASKIHVSYFFFEFHFKPQIVCIESFSIKT